MSIIFIKAEANEKIGGGHIYRSLSLARKIRDRGINVKFIFSDSPFKIQNKVINEGFEIIILDNGQQLNPEEYIKHIPQKSLILFDTDDYNFYSGHLIDELRKHFVKTACFTITDKYPITTNLLINPNIISQKHIYQTSVDTKKLLGPGFMIFRDEFRNVVSKKKSFQLPITILLIFGNADNHHLTLFFLDIIQKLGEYVKKIIVVCGSLNTDIHDIKQRIDTSTQQITELHVDVPNLDYLYNQVDVAITSAGMAMWEMALFRIPLIVFSSSTREIEYTNYLHKLNYIYKIGDISIIPHQIKIMTELKELFDTKRLNNLKLSQFNEIINPEGIDRIIDSLIDEIIIK
ncbi:MAG: hypothetical protein JW717_03185 [Marinilabiliaceae bacterium]|nr:hypothetical protein [Marinilabiliaceae bacterium]